MAENGTGKSGEGDFNLSDGDGDDTGEPTVINPAEIGTGTGNGSDRGSSGTETGGSGEAPRKRGRPKGSKNRATQADQKTHVNGIEKILLSAHMMLAGMTKSGEWLLDPAEAHEIAEAATAVSRHYPIFEQSEKAVDWARLLFALGTVYGSRIYVVYSKKKREQADNVVHFTG